MLQGMTLEDAPPGFMKVSKVKAKVCCWPKEEWAQWLFPLLTSNTQVATLSLPPIAQVSLTYGKQSSTAWDFPQRGTAAQSLKTSSNL